MNVLALAQAAAPPAGGAAIDQIIIATTGALVLTAGLLYLGMGHRSGRVPYLGRLADYSERVSGLPGWVALPSVVATGALLVAFLGFMWDVSIHIDNGRDEGPLANPSHYLILGGLFGIFSAGFFAMVLPLKKPSASAIRIAGNWYAPLGGVLITACGMFALIGFPLDDVWHRLFGQDVTLWGPTHLMLIGGAAMTLLGIAVLHVEGARVEGERPTEQPSWVRWVRSVALSGGLLIGLCVFQAEFDFGVPQFRLVFEPIMLMVASGVGLVATRIWLGRGAAAGAVGFFLVVRGAISLIVGPGVFDETVPHFPLFIVEALVIETVGLLVPRERTLAMGVWSGIGLGTIGLAAEWAWSNIWMPIPWDQNLIPEAAAFGFAAAIASALVGAWVGERLSSDELPRTRATRYGAIAGAAILFASVAIALNKPALEGVDAHVTLAEAPSSGGREVIPTVRFDPPSATDGNEMLNVTAWQGGGLVVEELEPTGEPGTFTTADPVPVYGGWKTIVRMSNGNTLNGVPIFLPEDEAIPAEEVPAEGSFTRPVTQDHAILQREQKSAAGWLTTAAYLIVGMIAISLLALIAWALHRLAVVTEPRGVEAESAAKSRRKTPVVGPRLPA